MTDLSRDFPLVRAAFADGVYASADFDKTKTVRTDSELVADCLCSCLSDYLLTRKKLFSFSVGISLVDFSVYLNIAVRRAQALQSESDVLTAENCADYADYFLLSAFAGGLFIACGAVASPDSGRFLSLSLYSDSVSELLRMCGFGFKNSAAAAHVGRRMYLKSGDSIADFLTFCGAGKCAMELMCSQIEKQRRRGANRAVNCDTANIDKSVFAGAAAIADIEFVLGRMGYGFLPPKLQAVAVARRDNPSATLADLAGLLSISKSGVSHRLSKISEIAGKLRCDRAG